MQDYDSRNVSARLLVVDDDAELCEMLKQLFNNAGYLVDFELEGNSVAARSELDLYQLLILDVMLPGVGGFELLRTIRKRSQIPVLMVTARTEPANRVLGLEAGADDYLLKPFFPDELLARVRAILRRTGPSAATDDPIEIDELRLIPDARDVEFRGKRLGLTAMEFEIMEQLMRACGRVVSRDSLSLQLYNRLPSPFDRSIDTHISRIRRKLNEGRDRIMSVRGTGYQLRPNAQRPAP